GAIRTAYRLYEIRGDERYLEEIFEFSDGSKQQVLSQLIHEDEAQSFAGIPDSLTAYERDLKTKLAAVRERIDQNLENPDADKGARSVLEDSAFTLNRSLQDHISFLEQRYPRYHDFKFSERSPDFDRLRGQLQEHNITLIEYFWSEDSLWGIVINNQGLHVKPLEADSIDDRAILTFNEAVEKAKGREYLRSGHRLYQTLVEPVAEYLETDRLLIIPDGALHLLPFEALLTERPQLPTGEPDYTALPYLITDYQISYSASARTLELEGKSRRSYEYDFAGFAPVFSSSPERIQRDSERTPWISLASLPSSRFELEEIAGVFENERGMWQMLTGSRAAQIFLQEEATEQAFKSIESADYRYIHLATHSFTDDSLSSRSGIYFHPDEENRNDGILRPHEIFNLSLDAELVVLSACDTGTGTVVRGEGIVGLSRAFQYAGAQNLLVSLWKVDDRATARLMINFYESVAEHTSLAESLRKAKQELIARTPYSAPRYWSSFSLIGY
ncbi:MAG: CHAT domain-containing protein, partial [Balneolaceae bacterium]